MTSTPAAFVKPPKGKPGKAKPKPDKAKPPKRKESSPLHALSEGVSDGMYSCGEGTHRVTPACEQFHSDVDKSATDTPSSVHSAADFAAVTSRDSGRGYRSADSFNTGRLSQGLDREQGHQDDGGNAGQGTGRNASLAYQHPSLRQSSVNFADVLARLSTVRGNVMDLGVSPDTAGGFSHAGEVALNSFDAANQASGAYAGMQAVNHDPLRPDYHPARGSGTNPNGSHSSSQASAVSNAVSCKADQVALVKLAMFGHE